MGRVVSCETCAVTKLYLLPENENAWRVWIELPREPMGGGPDYSALKLYYELYMDGATREEKKEVFEKLTLIHQIWQQKRPKK